MKQQEIKILKIIELLERDPIKSQRDLAKELNYSLGLVNAFIKRLVHKGYFKIKTMPKNRMKYILTPKGLYKKTKLTYQYLQYSLTFYKETRSKIRSIYDELSKQGKKRIFLVGTTELAEIAVISLQESNLDLAGIIDSVKIGHKFLGNAIVDYTSIENAFSNDAVIFTTPDYNNDLKMQIRKYNSSVSIIDLNSKMELREGLGTW